MDSIKHEFSFLEAAKNQPPKLMDFPASDYQRSDASLSMMDHDSDGEIDTQAPVSIFSMGNQPVDLAILGAEERLL